MYPNFSSFYAFDFFIDPQFLLFLSFGLLVARQWCYCSQEVVASGEEVSFLNDFWSPKNFREQKK